MICAITDFNDYTILQEAQVIDNGISTYKIRGNSLLQTLNEVNGNRRVYNSTIGNMFIQEANKKISMRKMCGETDHPAITNPKDPVQIKRQLQVPLKESSHKFTKIWREGDNICAIVETLSNDKGINLAKMATLDDIAIGFSCRALGNVKQKNYAGKSILEVCTPAIFVTYDAVSDPSHKVAELKDITDIITSASGLNKIQTAITESSDGQIILDESNSLYDLYTQFKDVIREPVTLLVENFINNRDLDYADSNIQSNFVQKNMQTLLSEYLSSSDYETGISTYQSLNESNVHSLMQDYSNNWTDPNYQSTSFMRDKILKYLEA